MQGSAIRAKKNLTQRSRSTQRTQRRRLTEEILGGGANDAGRGFRYRFVAIATNENNGRAFRLAHQEAGCRSQLIGDGEDRRGERLSLAILRASQIEKHGNAGSADGDICQAEAPGAAKSVADDDGEAFAGSLAERGDKLFGGTIGLAGEQSHDAAATNIRMVNPGIGADETVVSLRNQDVLAAHDAPRFLQNDFNDARVLLQTMGNGNRFNRRFYLCKPDHRSFGLGNDLLSDDKNVAIFEVHPCFPRRTRYAIRKVISPANFREPRDAKQPQAGSGRRSVLRGRGGFKRSGHGRGKGNLTRAGESFHLSRIVPRETERAGRLLQASAPPAITLPDRSVRSAVRFVVFFLVLRFIRLLVFWTFLLLLLLLLLFLLQLLLFLIVFVLHLLELPLLFLLDLFLLLLLSLLDLLLVAVVRSFLLSSLLFLLLLPDPLPLLILPLAEPFLILLNFLLLLDLLLLDPLPFLVLFLAELLGFLLMLLFELRVHISRRTARIVWPHRRRTVVVDSRIAGIRGRIARLVAGFVDVLIRRRRTVLHNGRVCRFHLRLSGVAWSSRSIARIVLHVAGPVGRNVLRRARFCRWGDFHRDWSNLGVLALLLPYFGNRDGPAAVRSDGFLLLFEASWRWGRRRLRYHAAALKHRRGTNPGRGAGAEDSLFRRRPDGRCRGRNRSVGNIPLVDFYHVLAHGLSGGEGLMGSGGDRAGNALVDILDVADANVVRVVGVVDHRGVVDVGDIRVVDRGVRYVHVIHVRAAYAIRRHVDLARPQREPRHSNATAPADSNAYGEVRAADPGHERGRVDRPNVSYFNHCRSWRARHPAPHTANDNPTSVMERCEAPRLIVNPSPAPGRDPNPVAVAVRSPSNYGSVREPDVAILGHGPPATVIIEILVADHVSRDVARRDGALFAAVAVAAPVIEIVFIAAKALHVGVKLFSPEERAGLPRMNRISRSTARDFAFAVANKHGGRVACLVHIDAIAAGTKNGKRQVWSVDLERFVVIETAHANIDGSFGDADLRDVVREVQEGKAGVARQADRRRTDVQLGARPGREDHPDRLRRVAGQREPPPARGSIGSPI